VLGAGENGPRMLMEGLALTGAWVDKTQGLLSMIALEMGVSSRQCAYLRPGEPVLVMGPTGSPTEIPHGENVLLAGGGPGQTRCCSRSRRPCAASDNRCLLRVGTRRPPILFKREGGQAATDQSSGQRIPAWRSLPAGRQDAHFRGNTSRR